MRAFDEYLSILKANLKEGEKLANVHVGNVSSRMDVTNKLIVRVLVGRFPKLCRVVGSLRFPVGSWRCASRL